MYESRTFCVGDIDSEGTGRQPSKVCPLDDAKLLQDDGALTQDRYMVRASQYCLV